MDQRYRSRQFTDYENEAFGTKDRPANTESLKNKESGELDEAESVQGSDIISRLKREWKRENNSSEKTAEQTKNAPQTGEQDCTPDKLVNQEDAEALDESAGLDSYKFDENADPLAAAPSDHQQASINPSELTRKEETDIPSSLTDTTPIPDSMLNKHIPTSSKTDQTPDAEPMSIDPGSGFSDSMSGCHTSIRRIDTDLSPDFPMEETAMEIDPSEVDNSDRGKQLWDHFQKLTQTAAQELCEQLRIVLEATKANGLQGDYKTGKRINMKKVIGYIASRYRKDKIW
jgi:midasin